MYRTSHELYPEDYPHHTWIAARDSNEAVDEVMEPSEFDYWAFIFAVDSYRRFLRYGLPYEGHERDMPVLWRLAVDCMFEAVEAARAQASAEARDERRREAESD